ncbi:MAG: c-type cytochrome [Candidatus Hermodarchaeia archaeon]
MNRGPLILTIGWIIILGACTKGAGTNVPLTENPTFTPLPTLDPIFEPEDDSVVIQETAVPPVPTLDPQLVSTGEVIYQQYCASCHGVNLEGQLNWKTPLSDGGFPAPPHDSTGHTWHHPDELLLDVIVNGSDPTLGGRMQGFGDVIDEQERIAVLEFIKSKWGDEERELQWWITAR